MSAIEYLLSIEGTEDEGRLFETLENLGGTEEELMAATHIPVVGKVITALITLCELGSVTEFKQTSHFDALEGWDFKVDLDKGEFSMYPGSAMRKKILATIGIVVGLVLLIKFLRRKK
ncbi:MAG: hypothetical protein FWD97_03870 [Defluviitaleaceae bacterium]|nr:hypothetical protein [Defluviitaleaceae bacterium]